MRDISLHLMDIAQNSIRAGASLVAISLEWDAQGLLRILVKDDGRGMAPAVLEAAQSPFFTSRTERRVGLGIPLLAQNARLCGGSFEITSRENEGTTLYATFDTKHIDCLPLGDIAETVYALIVLNPESPDFMLSLKTPGKASTFDTAAVRRAVGGLSLNEPEIAAWIRESLDEQLTLALEGII